MDYGLIIFGIIAIFVLVALSKTIYVVPQGQQFTLERLGQYQRTMEPGLHFTIPFVDRVAHRISMMEQVLDIPPLDAITRDNVSVRIDAIAYIQVFSAEKAAYEVEDRVEAISQLTNTSLRSAVGELGLDDVLSSRQEMNTKLMAALGPASEPWGVKITRIEIKDVQPPSSLIESMALEMRAERTKRAAVLEAAGLKSAEIARAEGAKAAQVLTAEGHKQAQVLNAEGERDAAILQAEARKALAEAEANATKILSEAIKSGDPQALQYFLGGKYIEAWGKLAESNNSKFVLVPSEMTALSGLMAGLKNFVNKS